MSLEAKSTTDIDYEFNKLAKEIYENNKAVGWWDNPNRCLFEVMQLISTEIAEATEGERKNLMDEHLPHRRMGEVELVDALIRLLDLGGHMNLIYNANQEKHEICTFAETHDVNSITVGRLHLFLNLSLLYMAQKVKNINFLGTDRFASATYTDFINDIMLVGQHLGYNIIDALHEKVAYNKTRLDHKRENRAKPGGKSF